MLHLDAGATLAVIPTNRPRHSITETDEVAGALKDAARRWPDHRGQAGKLLLDLIREGHRVIMVETESRALDRQAAIGRTAGALSGVYPEGCLEQLREEWPE